MALISAKTILISISLFHMTLGFFFLTNPATISDQALVYILGESMRMPYARGMDAPSPALAFLAVALATMGVTDLVTLSLPEEICLVHHWGMQAPLRLGISLLLVSYIFVFGPSSPLYFSSSSSSTFGAYALPSSGRAGDGLKNRVFFTFAFVEMLCWFWIWVTLREEQQKLLSRKAQRRRSSQGNIYH